MGRLRTLSIETNAVMARPTPLIPPPTQDIPLGEGRSLRIGAQVGRGSMATVYRGIVEAPYSVRRVVAVKVFDVIATDEHEAVFTALAGAARRSASLRHPNVVRLEGFGMVGPAQPYALLELVEGRTLARFRSHLTRRHERVPLDVALFIGLEIAEALAGARLACTPEGMRSPLVHGELASCDVLLSWHGEVKVGDFGFGVAARAASSVRSVKAVAQRVRALAPEVARGQLADARSDVFCVGVLLHVMLVGPRVPPLANEQQAITWARDGVVHQNMFDRQLPPLLRTILTRALEREPARRYPHAGAVAVELRRATLSMGVGDGRAFLRAALARAFGDEGAEDEEEHTAEVRLPQPSGVIDRFARLRGGEPPEDAGRKRPLESGTVLAAGVDDDDAEEA
jgi:serine/threonine protein kinase